MLQLKMHIDKAVKEGLPLPIEKVDGLIPICALYILETQSSLCTTEHEVKSTQASFDAARD